MSTINYQIVKLKSEDEKPNKNGKKKFNGKGFQRVARKKVFVIAADFWHSSESQAK
jgi:hypothetical protein